MAGIVGSGQLVFESRPNGRHRAEMCQGDGAAVAPRSRHCGAARCASSSAAPRERSIRLLVLDTSEGAGGARNFYEMLATPMLAASPTTPSIPTAGPPPTRFSPRALRCRRPRNSTSLAHGVSARKSAHRRPGHQSRHQAPGPEPSTKHQARSTVLSVLSKLLSVTVTRFGVAKAQLEGESVRLRRSRAASAFVDRADELTRLVADLSAGQKVFLISPRRYGKSSLDHRALAQLARGGLVTLELTVAASARTSPFSKATPARWPSRNARARAARGSGIRSAAPPGTALRARTGRRSAWPSPFPPVRIARDVARLADEVFALPARHRRGPGPPRRRIALDEFQDVAAFNGGSVEQALRAAVQHQRQVGYVFAGSEPSLMERMLGPRRPFYNAGPVMRLDRIPAPASSPPSSTRGSAGPASRPSPDSAPPSSSSPATCRTMSSDSRTRRGTMRGREGRGS